MLDTLCQPCRYRGPSAQRVKALSCRTAARTTSMEASNDEADLRRVSGPPACRLCVVSPDGGAGKVSESTKERTGQSVTFNGPSLTWIPPAAASPSCSSSP